MWLSAAASAAAGSEAGRNWSGSPLEAADRLLLMFATSFPAGEPTSAQTAMTAWRRHGAGGH
jgi:hypothetical protein